MAGTVRHGELGDGEEVIMPFSAKVQEDALVACGRYCCVCHRFAGTHIQIHHIVHESEGGSNDFDNAIPLCLDCHADMGRTDPDHPTRKAYTPSELKRHRDRWYKHVEDGLVNVETVVEQDEYRKKYLVLRERASYVLSFYGYAFANVAEKVNDDYEEARKALRDIGCKISAFTTTDRPAYADVPEIDELRDAAGEFIGLSNGLYVYNGGDVFRLLEDNSKREERIKNILNI